MIEVIGIIGCIFVFVMWFWYELKHPMDADSEHDEAVKFRTENKSLTKKN